MMENLPILIFEHLFPYLTIKERVKCSLVCKKWRLAYDLIQPSVNLFIYVKRFPLVRKSTVTNQSIRSQDTLKLKQFFDYEISRRVLKSLKKLIIFNGISFLDPQKKLEYDLSYLNNFTNLEHLEIYVHQRIPEVKETTQTLSLPNLKILIFENFFLYDTFELDCPKLEILKTDYFFKKFKIKHTDCIKYLDLTISIYSNTSDSLNKFLNQFKHLEILIISQELFMIKYIVIGTRLIDTEFLNGLSKLKLIIVFTDNADLFENLKLKKNRENLLNLKIIDYRSALPSFYNWNDYENHEYSENYVESLMNLSKSSEVIKLPFDFILNKTLQIKYFSISQKPDDHMSLIKFFKKLGFLSELRIDCVMDQEFYDLLPESLSIKDLYINLNTFRENIDTNFLTELDVCQIQANLPFIIGTISEDLKLILSYSRIILSNNRLKFLTPFNRYLENCLIGKKENEFQVYFFTRPGGDIESTTVCKNINEVLDEIKQYFELILKKILIRIENSETETPTGILVRNQIKQYFQEKSSAL